MYVNIEVKKADRKDYFKFNINGVKLGRMGTFRP